MEAPLAFLGIMSTGTAIFEELRFVWEYLAGVLIFVVPLAPGRSHLVARLAAAFLGCSVLALGYFPLMSWATGLQLQRVFALVWYVVMTFSMMACLRACFKIGLTDLLFVGISGYAAQHVTYAVVHELLALWVWTDLTGRDFGCYVLISEAFCALWYLLLYRIFAPRLAFFGGHVMEPGRQSAARMAALLCVLLACSFGFQHFFNIYEGNRATAVWMDLLVQGLVLGLQYDTLRSIQSGRENQVLSQMLREGEQHWRFSSGLIENVNRTVHDLKHTLKALEQLPEAERGEFVTQTADYINKYQMLVYSQNEVLNTILSEKAFLCERDEVPFSCSIGQVDLGFISAPDLCVLLGNVIDNAVEASLRIADAQSRAVSLAIKQQAGMLLITCDNPYEGELKMAGSLPMTSKADALRHGYGLKSVRAIAQKYDGTLFVGGENGVFTVQIVLPVPTNRASSASKLAR